MENTINDIQSMIKNENTRILFEAFLYNVYKYNTTFELNTVVNALKKNYGSGKDKLAPIIENMTYEDEFLLFTIFYKRYTYELDRYLKKQEELKLLKIKEKKAYKNNTSSSGYDDQIIRIENDLIKPSLSYFINRYIEHLRELKRNKGTNQYDDTRDFFSNYYFSSLESCKKYNHKVFNLIKLIDLNSVDKKATSIKKNFNKHKKYVNLYQQYIILNNELVKINSIKETDYRNFIKENTYDINRAFDKQISKEARTLIINLIKENSEHLLIMDLISYTRKFSDFRDFEHAKDKNVDSKDKYLFNGKNSTLPISQLLENIEKNKKEINFKLAENLLEISKI